MKCKELADNEQYDFALLGHLAGFTEMTAKKFWPPVKKKAMDQYPEFAKYINGGSAAASNSKVTMGKRKAADSDTDAGADADLEVNPKVSSADIADGKAIKDKGKKAPGKAKRGKKVKVEEAEDEPSADGGDGMGEFVYQKNVVDWLEMTDGSAAVV